MAQVEGQGPEPPPLPTPVGKHNLFRKLFGRQVTSGAPPVAPAEPPQSESDADGLSRPGVFRRASRKVVPGLPRTQTLKRQQSEQREHLAPVEPSADERRAVSVDRRSHGLGPRPPSKVLSNPRTSAPSFLGSAHLGAPPQYVLSLPTSPVEDELVDEKLCRDFTGPTGLPSSFATYDSLSTADTVSVTASEYDAAIHKELEKIWILNLSMHFRDRSKREKFFVTYREQPRLWRRVTVSVDYRDAPANSLEMELIHTRFQREKNLKIYEAIRESLPEIQFYPTVTNLKLETMDGRLHVHVVEDGNEIIPFPPIDWVQHLSCPLIYERDIVFDSHMSGFVYKVSVHGVPLIKKEIPSPETVDEFLYEINALNRLRFSNNVIRFYGVVVDDYSECVKGLLISYADQGALVDIIYDHCKETNIGLPWGTRERWARQIVQGLGDIHEAGFVQGDFTLSNIVVDDLGDAKIIDINRRGCPVGWEPPEATPLIETNQRISMYIGVKSDLYQLGMVLWALATQEDEPDALGRPLVLGPEVNVPDWYRQITEICLSDDPRFRLQASSLLDFFPPASDADNGQAQSATSMSGENGNALRQYLVDGYLHTDGPPLIRTVEPPSEWSYTTRAHGESGLLPYESYHHRGRSPPSPLPSNRDWCESPSRNHSMGAWAANRNIPPSYSDIGGDEVTPEEVSQHRTPTPKAEPGHVADSDTSGEPDSLVDAETALQAESEASESVAGAMLQTPPAVEESISEILSVVQEAKAAHPQSLFGTLSPFTAENAGKALLVSNSPESLPATIQPADMAQGAGSLGTGLLAEPDEAVDEDDSELHDSTQIVKAQPREVTDTARKEDLPPRISMFPSHEVTARLGKLEELQKIADEELGNAEAEEPAMTTAVQVSSETQEGTTIAAEEGARLEGEATADALNEFAERQAETEETTASDGPGYSISNITGKTEPAKQTIMPGVPSLQRELTAMHLPTETSSIKKLSDMVNPATSDGHSEDEGQPSILTSSIMEAARLPESLAGIGAAHADNHDEWRVESDMRDSDFDAMAPDPEAPNITITTDDTI